MNDFGINICEHGALARVCERCEDKVEITRLRAELWEERARECRCDVLFNIVCKPHLDLAACHEREQRLKTIIANIWMYLKNPDTSANYVDIARDMVSEALSGYNNKKP